MTDLEETQEAEFVLVLGHEISHGPKKLLVSFVAEILVVAEDLTHQLHHAGFQLVHEVGWHGTTPLQPFKEITYPVEEEFLILGVPGGKDS